MNVELITKRFFNSEKFYWILDDGISQTVSDIVFDSDGEALSNGLRYAADEGISINITRAM